MMSIQYFSIFHCLENELLIFIIKKTRRVLYVCNYTHTRLLFSLSDCVPIKYQILKS